MFEYAKALLFQHSWIMEPPIQWGTTFVVSKWPIGLSLLYMPILALLKATIFSGDPSITQIPAMDLARYHEHLLMNGPYLYASYIHPVIAALTAGLIFLLGRQLGLSKRTAVVAALAFGLASPAAVYARFDYAQPLAGLFLLVACWLVFLARSGCRWCFLLAGIAAGFAGLARNELYVIGALPIGIGTLMLNSGQSRSNHWFQRKRLENTLAYALPVGILFIANLATNAARFGSLTGTGYASTEGDLFVLGLNRFMVALTGNLFSPGRGIFLFFPLAILSPIGVVALFRRDRWAAGLLSSFILLALGLYAFWLQWAAGISWGPRFFIPFLPYITILAFMSGEVFQGYVRQAWYAALVILVVLGSVVSFQGLLFNFEAFYSSLHLPNDWIAAGDYNFKTAYSPIFSGWYELSDPRKYDIYLVQQILLGSRKAIAILAALGALFIGSIAGWVYWFTAGQRAQRRTPDGSGGRPGARYSGR